MSWAMSIWPPKLAITLNMSVLLTRLEMFKRLEHFEWSCWRGRVNSFKSDYFSHLKKLFQFVLGRDADRLRMREWYPCKKKKMLSNYQIKTRARLAYSHRKAKTSKDSTIGLKLKSGTSSHVRAQLWGEIEGHSTVQWEREKGETIIYYYY